jgi:hypothetical protein
MKVSVSLPVEDIEFLDDYLLRRGTPSRSAALHEAIDLLRRDELEDAYTEAWSGSAEIDDVWDVVAADGLDAAG